MHLLREDSSAGEDMGELAAAAADINATDEADEGQRAVAADC